jgi:hypothetical protein
MTLLAAYQTGNVRVKIFSDGTKLRTYPSEQKPKPLLPESIDLKITNSCGLSCFYCHESSSFDGSHANVETINHFINQMLPGTEVAIGGGNPLIHPELEQIIKTMTERRIIPNITINAGHLTGIVVQKIKLLRTMGIKGVGLTYHYNCNGGKIMAAHDDNTVIHVVLGIHKLASIRKFLEECRPESLKLLLLGFKHYGRATGLDEYHKSQIHLEILRWRYFLRSIVTQYKCHVSFDNLAIKQLQLKTRILPEVWKVQYMGDDGQHTMYIDAVKNQFAVNSTSERFNTTDQRFHYANLQRMFQHVRKISETA